MVMESDKLPPESLDLIRYIFGTVQQEGERSKHMTDKKLTLHEKFDNLKSTLTPHQHKHYDSIKWLYSGAFASGRTYVTAIIMIEIAIHNPGMQIHMLGHYIQHKPHNPLRNTICTLLKDNDMAEAFEINVNNNTLMYKE